MQQHSATNFNKLLGKNLLHQTNELVDYFSNFYDAIKSNLDINAIYVEMNEFTINWDLWFLELFAYDHIGEISDLDWLTDWEEGNSSDNIFPLTGFEDLQMAYQDYMDNEKYRNEKMERASNVAELLIILRLQELVRDAVQKAKQKNLPWATIPVFATAHDYDMIYRIN